MECNREIYLRKKIKRITLESVRDLRRRVNEAAGKIYAGIDHDTANENVSISNSPLPFKEYTNSCEKDPNNTYVVECDDESVYIYPYSEVEAGIKQAIEEVKSGAVEIDCVPGAYLSEDNEEDWELFLTDPDAWYKRVVEESYTDCDSSSGMCIFTLNGSSIDVIANGDLELNWETPIRLPKKLMAYLHQVAPSLNLSTVRYNQDDSDATVGIFDFYIPNYPDRDVVDALTNDERCDAHYSQGVLNCDVYLTERARQIQAYEEARYNREREWSKEAARDIHTVEAVLGYDKMEHQPLYFSITGTTDKGPRIYIEYGYEKDPALKDAAAEEFVNLGYEIEKAEEVTYNGGGYEVIVAKIDNEWLEWDEANNPR